MEEASGQSSRRGFLTTTLRVTAGWASLAGALSGARDASAVRGQTPIGGPGPDAPFGQEFFRGPVELLLASIPEQGGPWLTPEPTVALEPVHLLHVAETPLRGMLRDTAALLNRQWRPPDGTPASAPDASAKAVLLVDTGEIRAWEGKRLVGCLDDALRPLKELAVLAARRPQQAWADERERYPDGKPGDPLLTRENLALLGAREGNHRAGLLLFNTLSLAQRRELVETGGLALPGGSLNPLQQQHALATLRRTRFDETDRPLAAAETDAQEKRDAAWLASFGVLLSVDRDPVTNAVREFRVGIGTGQIPCALFSSTPERSASPRDVRGCPYPMEAATPAATDPYAALETLPFPRSFRLKEEETFAEVLSRLADELRLPMIADDYTAARALRPPDQAEVTSRRRERETLNARIAAGMNVAAALDALCTANERHWWRTAADGPLLFRSRHWVTERRYEVPPRILQHLSEAAAEEWPLRVPVLDALSSLSLFQLQGLAGLALASRAFRDPRVFPSRRLSGFVAGAGPGSAAFSHRLLRVYSGWTAAQKAQLLAQSGLPFGELRADQREAVWRALALSGVLRGGPDRANTLLRSAHLSVSLAREIGTPRPSGGAGRPKGTSDRRRADLLEFGIEAEGEALASAPLVVLYTVPANAAARKDQGGA